MSIYVNDGHKPYATEIKKDFNKFRTNGRLILGNMFEGNDNYFEGSVN